MKRKLTGLGIALALACFSFTNAVSVRTIKGKIANKDVSQEMTQVDGSYSLLDIISVVNKYLWFGIGLVCFLFLIWNGYKLIMARGDSKQMSSAMSAIIGCVVGIAVCLLAYIIVNLAIRLF